MADMVLCDNGTMAQSHNVAMSSVSSDEGKFPRYYGPEQKTRPDTRHKMRLVCVLFTFENNMGQSDERTDLRMDGHDLLWRCDGASKNDE